MRHATSRCATSRRRRGIRQLATAAVTAGLVMGTAGSGDAAGEAIFLDQGWSQAEREAFWWHPQGSRIIPYAWFLALERQDGTGAFAAPENLDQFGYLRGSRTERNPDGLPIGFARESGEAGEAWLGMTCAACHTGTVRYGGRAILIEGGAGGADYERFDQALSVALQATARDEVRFTRFAERLGQVGPEARAELRRRLDQIAARRGAFTAMNTPPHPFGPGRVDALGIIMNSLTATALDRAENARRPDAPVSLPSLWGTSSFARVQYNGSIANAGAGPLLRNTGQVLGVYGQVDLDRPNPRGAYASSASLVDLEALERQIGTLKPPAWPEAILPPIDRAKAEAGRTVFARECAGCHQPGERASNGLLRLTIVPLERLGTDPLAARNFMTRTAATGVLEGRPMAVLGGPTFGATAPAAAILGHVSTAVVSNLPAQQLMPQLQAYRAATAADPARLDGYKAPPLEGIWATAPYLHNGSVANLRQLLTPPAQRATRFTVSGQDFDPAAVGLPLEDTGRGFTLDTRLPGNSSAGHSYGIQLPDEEKAQLIEFLKTL